MTPGYKCVIFIVKHKQRHNQLNIFIKKLSSLLHIFFWAQVKPKLFPTQLLITFKTVIMKNAYLSQCFSECTEEFYFTENHVYNNRKDVTK